MAASEVEVSASPINNETGYRSFKLGKFDFARDEYYVYISWTTAEGKELSHTMSADDFLRAGVRCVAWGFFYGWLNFDNVFGTQNLYGRVRFYAGTYHPSFRDAGLAHEEIFETPLAMATFKELMADWTNEDYDPFAAPDETSQNWIGKKNGTNSEALGREREVCRRMPGLPGDAPLRTDENGRPVNRAFHDVSQDQPEIHVEPGFEGEVYAHNLYGYLSRSDVTWNPSVSSVCKNSLFCPTTEEYTLPVLHGNDRMEWFVQLSDQIDWEVEDKETGSPRAKVIMKAGDIAAMPADIRHQGISRKRCMLLVWENANPELPKMLENNELPVNLSSRF